MYAIIKHSGAQAKVVVGKQYLLDRMESPVDTEVSLDEVVLMHDGKKIQVGTPLVAGASVKVKVIAHPRGEKIRVRHFKRRKHHMKCNGHRQSYTKVEVLAIEAKTSKAKAKTAKKSD